MADEHRRGRRGSVETSLRTSAVWSSVLDLVTRRQADLGRPLRVLDLGGGTGGLAVPLAEHGHHVTVVDPSPDALASLSRRSAESGVAERITAAQGDADTLDELLGGQPVDLVCCHGTLEVVDDPQATLASLAGRRRPGRLPQPGRRTAARRGARPRAGRAVHPGPRGPHELRRPLGPGRPAAAPLRRAGPHRHGRQAGLTVRDVHGVRLFSDLVPSALVDSEADRLALLRLEQEASRHPDFGFLGQLGASLHVLASRD